MWDRDRGIRGLADWLDIVAKEESRMNVCFCCGNWVNCDENGYSWICCRRESKGFWKFLGSCFRHTLELLSGSFHSWIYISMELKIVCIGSSFGK